MSTEWDDDRPGMMRVHVAAGRAQLLCDRLSWGRLRAAQRAAGAPVDRRRRKEDYAWALTVNGFVDEHGNLREGWPA